jgi:site-specific DNA-methyltransferase (adenine-specific)
MKLLKGDCLDRMKEIPDGSVDMILTDPPYGTTACKWDSIIPLEPMWEQLKRVIKPNGAIVMTASQPFTSVLICSNLNMFKTEWIWIKNKGTGHLNAKKMPMKFHENILVFYSKPPIYNPIMTEGHKVVSYNQGKTQTPCYGVTVACRYESKTQRQPRNILEIPVVNNDSTSKKERRMHPTQKPVALMEYLIKTYTNEGEIVLDFTMGSGTTGVACIRNNRKFIGIELDKLYFDIAYTRLLNEYLFGCANGS